MVIVEGRLEGNWRLWATRRGEGLFIDAGGERRMARQHGGRRESMAEDKEGAETFLPRERLAYDTLHIQAPSHQIWSLADCIWSALHKL